MWNRERVWTVWESMEQHGSLSAYFFEGANGHAVPWTERVRRRFGLLNQSSCLKLLGFASLTHHFPTASAQGLCRAFDRIGRRFDLIGLISAVGTSAAMKSLSYSALNDVHFYITGHVGPGSLNIGAALYQATGFSLGAFGGSMGDSSDPTKLEATDGLRYIGLQAYTDSPVLNVVGESVVQEHESLWPESMRVDIERDANRPTKVIVLHAMEDPNSPVETFSLKATVWIALLSGWLPLALTIAVIVSCCFCKLWFVAGLILFGTLSMMVAVLGLRHFCHFRYSKPKVAGGIHRGEPKDYLIAYDKEDVLCIVHANESTMQKLFQRKIVFQTSAGKYILFLAASMLYIFVFVSVLSMSNVPTSGQIHFAIANLIGLVADMAKASQYRKLAMARKACEQFKIEARCTPDIFPNRTAAMAFVATYADDPSVLKFKKLLPCDGRTWEEWWKRLGEQLRKELPYKNREDDLLADITGDMIAGIKLRKNRDLLANQEVETRTRQFQR